MILLDTSVLVYAVGDEHPLRSPARELLDRIPRLSVDVTTTVEVIQEFAHVHARRRARSTAAALARTFSLALRPISTTAEDLIMGMDLYEQAQSIGAFDAVLAAVSIGQDAEALVSADRTFAEIPNVRWIDLGSGALGALLDRFTS